MPDLITALALVSLAVAIALGVPTLWVAYQTLKRTAKLPEPPIVPVSTLILGASVANIENLPTYSPGMSRMGFGRFGKKS